MTSNRKSCLVLFFCVSDGKIQYLRPVTYLWIKINKLSRIAGKWLKIKCVSCVWFSHTLFMFKCIPSTTRMENKQRKFSQYLYYASKQGGRKHECPFWVSHVTFIVCLFPLHCDYIPLLSWNMHCKDRIYLNQSE